MEPQTRNLKLTAVVAMTANRVIGRDGGLPWHLPEDLAFFRKTTTGHTIVMGRRTYDSIGRPLPKRRNIVLTRDPDWSAPGVEVIHGPEELAKLPDLAGEVFVIGGAEVYRALMPVMDEWLVSHVKENYSGDTQLPAFEKEFPLCEIVTECGGFTVKRWTRG